MKPTDSLHAEDHPLTKQVRGLFQHREVVRLRFAVREIRQGRVRLRRLQPDPWAAPRTGNVLSVEPAVERVGVFVLTFQARREIDHRRSLTVERGRGLNAEPRTTVGAAGQGKPVPAVARVVELGQTGRARGKVGRDDDAHRRDRVGSRVTTAKVALLNRKAGAAFDQGVVLLDFVNLCRNRTLCLQTVAKGCQSIPWSFNLDDDTLRRILDPARQPRSAASRATNGRKPTPWTRPRTRSRVAMAVPVSRT